MKKFHHFHLIYLIFSVLCVLSLTGCTSRGEKDCINNLESIATRYGYQNIDNTYYKYDKDINSCYIGYRLNDTYIMSLNGKQTYSCTKKDKTDFSCGAEYAQLTNAYGMTFYRYGN